MKRGVARFVHASAFAIGVTGLAWAWMAYLWDPGPEPEDPEQMLEWTGLHPSLPLVRDLHLLAAPLAVFAVGLIWTSHVAPRLRKPWARRRTGLALAILFAPMVVSGVLLQTATSEEARTLWVWVHAISATIWIVAYLVHQLGSVYRRTKS